MSVKICVIYIRFGITGLLARKNGFVNINHTDDLYKQFILTSDTPYENQIKKMLVHMNQVLDANFHNNCIEEEKGHGSVLIQNIVITDHTEY